MKELLKRFKSPVAVSALAALIFFIVKEWCGLEIPGWDKFVELVIAFGLAFGIMNNPADQQNF